MKTSSIIASALVFICGLFMAQEARAQGVSGYTTIDYYQDTNTVDAYSETDVTYDIAAEYDTVLILGIVDQNMSVIHGETDTDYSWCRICLRRVPLLRHA